jgi:hypothetical protein
MIRFSQGGEWNALMSRYMVTIPPSDAPCRTRTQSR